MLLEIQYDKVWKSDSSGNLFIIEYCRKGQSFKIHQFIGNAILNLNLKEILYIYPIAYLEKELTLNFEK